MRCDVPAGREDEEVGEGGGGVARLGSKDAEDGRVDVIDGNGADVDEFGEIVLVRYLMMVSHVGVAVATCPVTYIVSVPSDDVKWRVSLCALKELATEFVYDLPRFLLDLVLGLWCEKVTRICEAISTKWSQFRQLEARAPDFEDISSRGSVR